MTTAKWTSIQQDLGYAFARFNEKGKWVFAGVCEGGDALKCKRKIVVNDDDLQQQKCTIVNAHLQQQKWTIVNAHLQQQTCSLKK